MRLAPFIKKYSLRVMAVLFSLMFIWFLIYIFKETFNYTIFSSLSEDFFFASILGIIALMGAVGILNITANLNLISGSLVKEKKGLERIDRKFMVAFTFGILGFVIFVGIFLSAVNRMNTRQTSKDILVELSEISENHAGILEKIAADIENEENYDQIISLLNLLDVNTPSVDDFDILFPKEIEGQTVFLQIQRWAYVTPDNYYSPISDTIFDADEKEMGYLFETLTNSSETEESLDEFFIDRPLIRVYSPVFIDGDLKFFLFSSYNEIQGKYIKSSL